MIFIGYFRPKSERVESFWRHDVSRKSDLLLARKLRLFFGDISLFCRFCLRQLYLPLFGFFWFVPGFVEVDQVPPRLYRVRVVATHYIFAFSYGFKRAFSHGKRCFTKVKRIRYTWRGSTRSSVGVCRDVFRTCFDDEIRPQRRNVKKSPENSETFLTTAWPINILY
jgi:hypothetical protein